MLGCINSSRDSIHVLNEARDSCAGLRDRFSDNDELRCELVVEDPTLLFQTDLVLAVVSTRPLRGLVRSSPNTEHILLTVNSCVRSVDSDFQKPGDCYRGDISMCTDGDSSGVSATPHCFLALSQLMQRSHEDVIWRITRIPCDLICARSLH